MYGSKIHRKYLSVIPAVLLLIRFFTSRVFSTTSQNIEATIKISVCGNGEIEGGEDCEGTDLGGFTCATLGYASGTLSCDTSCSFDEYSCVEQSSSFSSSPDAGDDSDDSDDAPSDSSGEGGSSLEESSSTVDAPVEEETLLLPPKLISFDPNRDGKIVPAEIYIVARKWVEEWRQLARGIYPESGGSAKALPPGEMGCDLNNDSVCDLRDFSILLFYVGKTKK